VLRLNNARTALFDGDVNGSIQFSNNEATAGASGVRSEITSLLRDVSGKTDVVFTTAGSGVAATEKLRILADGGITFNGDTLAANALDDYEEGTWTYTIAFGGASTLHH
jgi:archaellum component FlaF (FlaF/FlaG flagellin family)